MCNTTLQSVVASTVDPFGFLQCKQFVVKFALQRGHRVSFNYFVGLFVVNKGVHLVVVVCHVQNNRHQSLFWGQYDYVLVGFQSFHCKLQSRGHSTSDVILDRFWWLVLTRQNGLNARYNSLCRDICLGVTESLSPLTTTPPLFSLSHIWKQQSSLGFLPVNVTQLSVVDFKSFYWIVILKFHSGAEQLP